MSKTIPHTVLSRAKALLANPGDWCQRKLKNNAGDRCLYQAIKDAAKANNMPGNKAMKMFCIANDIGFKNPAITIPYFNDDIGMSFAGIHIALDRAIAMTA